MPYLAGASPTFPLHTDERNLGQLLGLAQTYALDFRADEERPAGSTLKDIPAGALPDSGGGARDVMRVFQERWDHHPTTFFNRRNPYGPDVRNRCGIDRGPRRTFRRTRDPAPSVKAKGGKGKEDRPHPLPP